MRWSDFKDSKLFFVVICFIQDEDLTEHRRDLEALGSQSNVKLVVQPCPYEGIEFLHRIDTDLLSHRSELNEHVFCKALTLKLKTPAQIIETVAENYHAYFVAVLDQNEAEVRKQSQTLQGFSAHFEADAAV